MQMLWGWAERGRFLIAALDQELHAKRPVHFLIGHPLSVTRKGLGMGIPFFH